MQVEDDSSPRKSSIKKVADATVIRASDEAKVGNPALSPVATRELALA